MVELSKKVPGFITLTQNVDGRIPFLQTPTFSFYQHQRRYRGKEVDSRTGLSQRAGHPKDQLKLLHGSLFDIKCTNCNRVEENNYDDPFHPVLDIKSDDDARLAASSTNVRAKAAYMDPNVNTTTIDPEDLPKYVVFLLLHY